MLSKIPFCPSLSGIFLITSPQNYAIVLKGSHCGHPCKKSTHHLKVFWIKVSTSWQMLCGHRKSTLLSCVPFVFQLGPHLQSELNDVMSCREWPKQWNQLWPRGGTFWPLPSLSLIPTCRERQSRITWLICILCVSLHSVGSLKVVLIQNCVH